MLDQSLFLACNLLNEKVERPGAGEFEKKEEKIKTIVEKVIKK